jgi:hypothetical protein
VLALSAIAGIAYAHSGGITGASGKQGVICNDCHQGGKTPAVRLVGPGSLDAGEIAVYKFYIDTDAAITGMNAAATDGVVLTADPDGGDTQFDDPEVTHIRPQAPDAGEAVFTFSMTAPAYGGTVTLWAAGNACNGDGTTNGDEASGTKMSVVVNGPPAPDAGSPGAGDAGTPVKGDPVFDAGATVPGSGRDAGAGAAPPSDSGCAIGPDRSSLPAGALLTGFVGLALLGRRRRR